MTISEKDFNGLRIVTIMLITQARSAITRAEALRALLVAHGVLSQEEYERTHAEAKVEFDRVLAETMKTMMDTATAEALLKQLQNYEGTPH
jgi:hypothetical protein